VQLVLISPLTRGEVDSATAWLRARWPGSITLDRVAAHRDSAGAWHLEHALLPDDPLAPAAAALPAGGTPVRLVRTALSAADSAVARSGGTVVHWPGNQDTKADAQGLVVGNDVLVATLVRAPVNASSRAVAHWADGQVAASEVGVGTGCIREVGIGVPEAGDLPLHAPFQRVVRALLQPCGLASNDEAADDALVAHVIGNRKDAASGAALRGTEAPPTPLVKWLLVAAMLLALAELVVRRRMPAQAMA
jgi:hypothetical protein